MYLDKLYDSFKQISKVVQYGDLQFIDQTTELKNKSLKDFLFNVFSNFKLSYILSLMDFNIILKLCFISKFVG